MQKEEWFEMNRASWDERVPIHVRSTFYDVESFKAGKSSLAPHEAEDLGSVAGKDLVHLQCHFGLDTLSWAQLGAQVTGLDFSQAAIDQACALAEQTGIEADFVCANVYEAPQALDRQFDIVYTGLGALCWLPDIERWARVVADLLRPGGELYLFEFHPILWVLDDEAVTIKYDYFTPPEGVLWSSEGSYADTAAETSANDTRQWNHPLGDVVTALTSAGLEIKEMREQETLHVKPYQFLESAGEAQYRTRPALPVTYTLRVSKR